MLFFLKIFIHITPAKAPSGVRKAQILLAIIEAYTENIEALLACSKMST